jgi:hypothetical protein
MGNNCSPRRYLVVTNCTARKRRSAGAPLSLQGLVAPTLAGFADKWFHRITAAPGCNPAIELYVGRGFVEALKVTRLLGAELFVVSAGLGLVPASERIPSYDVTVAPGRTSLSSILRAYAASPCVWWGELARARGQRNPVAELVESRRETTVLIALSAGYVEFIADDLASVDASQIDRLRIFTSPPGRMHVAAALQRAVLPYDARLEATAFAGTNADFPQRAMRHYVEHLRAATLPSDHARRVVHGALKHLQVPALPERERKSDEEVTLLISEQWDRFSGNSARLLRYLRDEAKVACEQSRFRTLWHSVRERKNRRLLVGNHA